jgi:hypothetical protein
MKKLIKIVNKQIKLLWIPPVKDFLLSSLILISSLFLIRVVGFIGKSLMNSSPEASIVIFMQKAVIDNHRRGLSLYDILYIWLLVSLVVIIAIYLVQRIRFVANKK